jgi:pseudouridine-5'-phosphate glycosidase
MQRALREGGAVPATVAIIEGELRIGLDEAELIALAEDRCAGKAASGDLAFVMSNGGTAGTTVSATLLACAFTHSPHPRHQGPTSAGLTEPGSLTGIRVFVTGGIGGVHRHWQQRPDISADLWALATTPVCVVCSGAKSILDLPATLEALETLGVPVSGYRTNCFPQFVCAGSDDLPVRQRSDDVDGVARMCTLHWSTLGSRTGIVLANPVSDQFALDSTELERAVGQAQHLASSRGIAQAARTPFLLSELARLTDNRSLDANLALLIDNARLAAELAVALVTAGNLAPAAFNDKDHK